MTPRPHDALFKSAFEDPEAVAPLLRELLPAPIRDAVAWETLAHEPGSFVDPELADHHNDLLFSARLRFATSDLLFFLLEHQSTGDPAMPLRSLALQQRIWDRARKEDPSGTRLPAIITVLVSHVPGGWTAPRAFEELFDPAVLEIPGLDALIPRFSLLVEDLDRLSNANLLARSLAPFQQLTLWLLRDSRDSPRLLRNFDAWIPVLERAGPIRDGSPLRVLFVYMFRVIDPRYRDQLRAKLRKLSPRLQEVAMSIADLLHDEGFAKGRITTLRRLLVFKFGALDAASDARLQAAPPEAIDRYLERVLTENSVAGVLAD
jgi:hypothetical protein